MGLLDKAVKLASTAKDQYGELRIARDEAAVKPVVPTPLSDYHHEVLRRAMAHGAPDPDALLSRPEASHVVGVELGEARLVCDDSSVGVEFAADGRKHDRWSVRVSAWHGDEDGFDPAGQYDFIAEHVEGDAIPGLGRRALWDGDRLFVLAPPLLFHVEVITPESGSRRAEAIAVAHRVLARIEE